MSVLK